MPQRGERGRGRPKKVGRYKYFLATGNPKDMVVKTYDTDTEVKRAGQKFWKSFEEHTRFFEGDNHSQLAAIRVELDELHERPPGDFVPDVFANAGCQTDALVWEMQFAWGTTARCEIWRVPL